MTQTAATQELKYVFNNYFKIFPKKTFPYLPFILAAFFQSLAWSSGPIFLNKYSLLPRMLILIIFAIGEYIFMSPTMNAGVELYNMKEAELVTEYHVTTLIVFILVNIYVFKKSFETKYLYAFIFAGLAVYFANK
jgi:uncharacterized protein (DUF486 family)